MGFRLAGHILETVTGVTPAQKLILIGLAERADATGRYAWPSVATLAKYAECSPRNVELGLRHLVDEGWIGVQKKATNRLPTTYYINLERLLAGRGEESSPHASDTDDLSNEIEPIDARGEEVSPQGARGEESAPPTSRGELFGTAGANFSASRGEESSPDPVSNKPIPEPIRGETAPTARLERPVALVACWNHHRDPGPKVEDLTQKRDRLYSQALAARPLHAEWVEAITWLNGQAWANARGVGEHATWRATLDWLAKPGQLAATLEQARTDAIAPPRRPRIPGAAPSYGTPEEVAERRQRASERRRAQDALADQASALVLDLSPEVRAVLEADVLAELEPYRQRVSASEFDDLVLRSLPKALIDLAHGRPLTEALAELSQEAR